MAHDDPCDNYDGAFTPRADTPCRRETAAATNPVATSALNIKSRRLPDGYGFRGSLWGAPIAKLMVRANGGRS